MVDDYSHAKVVVEKFEISGSVIDLGSVIA